MKKQIIIALSLLIFGFIQAQKTENYIHFNIGTGEQNLSYKLQNGTKKAQFGYTINAAYSHFFSSDWGVQTGLGLQSFNASSTLNYQSSTPNVVDIMGDSYEFRNNYKNWKEKQQTLFIDIPLEAQYRYLFSPKLRVLASAGAKISIPVQASYKTVGGEMVTTGYYSKWNVVLHDLPQYGFSTYTNSYNGNLSLKPAYMAIADLGGLYKLSEKLELYVGGYFNYGLNNIQKASTQLLYQSDGVYYGLLGSNQTSKVRPIAFGLKVGVYWKVEQKKKKIGSGISSVATAQPLNVSPSKKQDVQGEVASTSVKQAVKAPIKTVSISQSNETTQPEVSKTELNTMHDNSLSIVSGVESNENNVLESNTMNTKTLVEASTVNGGLEKVSDNSLSIVSGVKSNKNDVLKSKPENTKTLVEASTVNGGLEKVSDNSLSIVSGVKSTKNDVLKSKPENTKTLVEASTVNGVLENVPDNLQSSASMVKLNENNILERKPENTKMLVEASTVNRTLEKAPDNLLSNASIVKSSENAILESKPKSTKVIIEPSAGNLDKVCKASHSITLRFEFNDNNSLDTELDKMKILAETLKANPDLDLFIVNHTYDVDSQKINMEVGFKRALLMKGKLVELGVSSDQLKTDSKEFYKPLVYNISKKKRTRHKR